MGYRRVIVSLFALIAVALATRQGDSTLSPEQRMKAVAFVRIVNTAEADYFGTAKQYGSLNELREAGSLKQAESMFPDSGATTPAGFAVRVVVSDDKKGYQVSVTQDVKPFAIGFFSDERGLIYEGHPLQ